MITIFCTIASFVAGIATTVLFTSMLLTDVRNGARRGLVVGDVVMLGFGLALLGMGCAVAADVAGLFVEGGLLWRL